MSKSRLEEDAEPAECEQLFALAQALGERPHDFTQLHNDRGKCNINHKYSWEKVCVHPFHITKEKKKKSFAFTFTPSLPLPQQQHYWAIKSKQVAREVRWEERKVHKV